MAAAAKRKRPDGERDMPASGFCKTIRELSAVTGIPKDPLLKASAAGHIGKGPAGFSVREAIAWRFGDQHDTESIREAQGRLAIARANLAEHQLTAAKGLVISVGEHDQQLVRLARLFVSVLECAGPELAPRVAGHTLDDCRRIVNEYFRDKRAELTRSADPGGGQIPEARRTQTVG